MTLYHFGYFAHTTCSEFFLKQWLKQKFLYKLSPEQLRKHNCRNLRLRDLSLCSPLELAGAYGELDCKCT